MVAVAILAIGVTAILRLQGQSASMAADSRFMTTAPLLAQKKMAELFEAGPGELFSGSGDFGPGYPGYTWSAEISEPPYSEILDEATRADLKQILLTVSFDGGTLAFQLKSLRFAPEEVAP
ncbi:MAG: hypothetical protein JRI97_10665 [Deltaproteobacteria bacterium]|nr:hypothetical protein [Deltaproteobacteria bacterium]